MKSEIHEENPGVLGGAGFVDYEEVARMRVGVEQAVHEDLLAVGAREDLDHASRVDAARDEPCAIVDAQAPVEETQTAPDWEERPEDEDWEGWEPVDDFDD